MTAPRAWVALALVSMCPSPVQAGAFCPDLLAVLARAPDFKAIGAGPVAGAMGLERTRIVLNGFPECEIAARGMGLWWKHGREYHCSSVAMEETQARAWAPPMAEAVRACLPEAFEASAMPDFTVSRNGGETREAPRCAKRPDGLTVCVVLRHVFTNAMARLSGRPPSDVWRVWLTVSKPEN